MRINPTKPTINKAVDDTGEGQPREDSSLKEIIAIIFVALGVYAFAIELLM